MSGETGESGERGEASETLDIADEAAMEALGRQLAASLPPRALITLSGELGAGKSVLARAVLRAFGHEGPVPSPTYAIVESYALATRRVAHLDLYRLTDPGELHDIGFDEVLAEHDVVLIEWPERGGTAVPVPTLAVRIAHASADRRRVLLTRP